MASDIENLQADIGDQRISVSALLRKALMVAHHVGDEEFIAWVRRELDGCPRDQPEADYRRLSGEYVVLAANGRCIPIDWKGSKPWGSTRFVTRPLPEMESLMEGANDAFAIKIEVDASALVRPAPDAGESIVFRVTRSAVAGLLNSVRNRILDWSLGLVPHTTVEASFGIVAGEWHLQFCDNRGNVTGGEQCRIDLAGGYYLLHRRPGQLWCKLEDFVYDPVKRTVSFTKVKQRGKSWRMKETLVLAENGKRMEGYTDAGRALVYTRLPADTVGHDVAEDTEMRDFFISYSDADQAWAEWIAWTLEEAGYSVVLQAWDFRPGANFVLEMHKAAAGTEKTIAVLSEHYLQAEYTHPEWAAALAKDPKGEDRKLVPVRVTKCSPTGMLTGVVYVDLVGVPEDDARIILLGAFSERAKPQKAPPYPGAPVEVAERLTPDRKEYPGESHAVSVSSSLGLTERILVQVVHREMSPNERLELMQKLNSIPPPQFNMLVFAIDPPAGLIPPMPAPQADRSDALLGWAKAPGGCGLGAVSDLLEKIIRPR